MQQTSQYKLNLIESGDTFSATPLNENAEKLESALQTLNQSVDARGNCFLKYGSYKGNGAAGNTVTLGYKPTLLILLGTGLVDEIMAFVTDGISIMSKGEYDVQSAASYVALTASGFKLLDRYDLNAADTTQYYVAFR